MGIKSAALCTRLRSPYWCLSVCLVLMTLRQELNNAAFAFTAVPRTTSIGTSYYGTTSFPPVAFRTRPLNAVEEKTKTKEAVEEKTQDSPIKAMQAALEVAVDGAASIAPPVVNGNPGGLVARVIDGGVYDFNKFVIDTVYDIICFLYPVSGTERDFARFYVLETVARVPYFAYLSVMHLRETFGDRTETLSDRMRTHYAEADNELHHLLIMESLGGNASVIDRTLAQTMAFGYYWYVVIVYMVSDQAAYHLSELIEDHAYETYDNYLKDYGEQLKSKPVPAIATKYYVEDNPFLFDLFCTVKDKDAEGNYSSRRPELASLYDVFVNIRDDEKEHWKTLCNLVQYNDMQGVENKFVTSTSKGTDLV